MTGIWTWFTSLDLRYEEVLVPLITTLVTLLVGYKLRPWIGCKIGLHKWQTISLQRNEYDVQSFGRICWDDCYVQVWTSAGFVDRKDTYVVLRRSGNRNSVINVGSDKRR